MTYELGEDYIGGRWKWWQETLLRRFWSQEKGSENNNKATGNGMEINGYVWERVRNRINQAMEVKEKRGN